MSRLQVVLAMPAHLPGRLFDAEARDRLHELVEVDFETPLEGLVPAPPALADADVLVTGWGSGRVDDAVLRSAPRLAAVLHAAGSVRGYVDPVCWERGVRVSSARTANARPVAEYTLAMILLAGKGVFTAAERYARGRGSADLTAPQGEVGNYRRRVGLVGASSTGRRVIELLRPHDLRVWVHDPHLSAADAVALGVTSADLDEVLATCDVVSLHAPLLSSTRHLLDRRRLGLLRDGAVLVNTARGGLVAPDALLAELTTGRISAILDVTEPEPLDADSPLFGLPNVLVTPHVAGALGNELFRLGAFAATEIENLVAGRPLDGLVTVEDARTMA